MGHNTYSTDVKSYRGSDYNSFYSFDTLKENTDKLALTRDVTILAKIYIKNELKCGATLEYYGHSNYEGYFYTQKPYLHFPVEPNCNSSVISTKCRDTAYGTKGYIAVKFVMFDVEKN